MPRQKREIDLYTRRVARNVRALLQHRGWSYAQLSKKLRQINGAQHFDPSALSRYLSLADATDPDFTSFPVALAGAVAHAFRIPVGTLFQEALDVRDLETGREGVDPPPYHIVDLLRDNVEEYLHTVERIERAAESDDVAAWVALDLPMISVPSGPVFEEYLNLMGDAPRSDSGIAEIHRRRLQSKVPVKNILLTEHFEGFLRRLSQSSAGSGLSEEYLSHLISLTESGRYLLSLTLKRRLVRAGFSDLLRFTAIGVFNQALVVLRSENNLIVWSEHPLQVRRYLDRIRDLASHVLPISIRYNEQGQREHSLGILKEYLVLARKGEFRAAS